MSQKKHNQYRKTAIKTAIAMRDDIVKLTLEKLSAAPLFVRVSFAIHILNWPIWAVIFACVLFSVYSVFTRLI